MLVSVDTWLTVTAVAQLGMMFFGAVAVWMLVDIRDELRRRP